MNENFEQSSTDLFNQGKKLYIIGDYGKALECLIKACKSRELTHGHLHADMFEPYFYLAKAYYMYSKNETELLGEGLEKNADSESKDVPISINDKVIEEKNLSAVEESSDLEENESNDGDEKSSKNSNSEQGILENAEKEPKKNIEQSNEVKKDKESLSYLQLAYETMECAKLILKKQINEKTGNETELELKLADCCDLVGNTYMEEGVMEESIAEYRKALEYRQKHLEASDRAIAESYFNLGMVYSSDLRSAEAIEAYAKCKSIVSVCQNSEENSNKKELEDIIADIDERITDCMEGAKDYELAKESIRQFLMVTSSSVPANDVTHLLRRKLSAPATEEAEPPISKRKLE